MRIHISLFILSLLIASQGYADKAYWSHTTGNKKWSNGANWSTGTAPGLNDTAIFDNTSTHDCDIDVNISVKRIEIKSTYSGTVEQKMHSTITVGIGGYLQEGGTFTGKSDIIMANGAFELSGGIFTSTSTILQLSDNYSFSGGTFNHNNGTVQFSSSNSIDGNIELYDLDFNNSGTNTITSGDTLTVNGTLSISGSSAITINTGVIAAKGNIDITNTNENGGGTGTILIDGTTAQTITSSVGAGRGELPNVYINKTADTLFLSGTISVNGNWTYNTGTVEAQTSTVAIYGNRDIDCEGVSSSMAFYNLTFPESNKTSTINGDMEVSNTFNMGSSHLLLNGNTLTLSNNSTVALIRTTGDIVSEATDNSSNIKWNISSTTGAYVFPFALSAGGTEIPLTYELTGGNAGYVTASTYPTAADNTPLPTTPDLVSQINNGNGDNNSANMINRFWQIDKDGPSGTANLTYTYAQTEIPANGETNLIIQRWNTALAQWDAPLGGQVNDVGANTITVPNVTAFSPSGGSQEASTLPIALTYFKALLEKNAVKLLWETATEINNDFFTVEKSNNGMSFTSVAEVSGAGNSSVRHKYATYDENPTKGTSYYRLKQTDYDGEFEFFDMIAVNYNIQADGTCILTVNPNPCLGNCNIALSECQQTDNAEIYIEMIDALGNKIYSQIPQRDFNGNTSLHINTQNNLAPGVYVVRASSPTEKYTKKVIVK